MTFCSIIPSSVLLFFSPTSRNLLLGSASCAWGFFLFSFQVHEKSVLLPLMPSTMLLFGPTKYRSWIGYINIVATFSMWPLLKKDGLCLQYFLLTGLWIWLGSFWHSSSGSNSVTRLSQVVHLCTYLSIFLLHFAETFVEIPGKPDLFTVLNVLLCAPAFGLFYLWTIYNMIIDRN